MSAGKDSLTASRGETREVLLVFPGKYKASNPQVPLSLLHVASPLMRDGYKVRILDMRIENFHDYKLDNPVFVGISSMTGIQILHGLKFAEKIRSEEPACPIVWGGVHPSLLPEQTAASKYVDVVVRGEGESSIVELARKLEAEQPLTDVVGITYKSGGEIRSNPDGPLIDLDAIPLELPFELFHLDKYPSLKAGRFHVQTSRGCPHDCGYCYNSIFNHQKWRGKSAERVLDEIEFVLEKFPNVKIIDPIDDNFFVDKKRVEDICRGMIKRKLDVSWRANCRFDYVCNYGEEFIGLLEKSGCVELDFGGETGSDRLLSLIRKDITSAQMVGAVEKLRNYAPSIEPYVSWMSGLPTETAEDLEATFNIMDKMTQVNPKTQHFCLFLYTPFPSPLLEQLGPEFKQPQSLEEWGAFDMFHFNPPWHSKKYVERLNVISAVTNFAFYPEARIRERGFAYRFGYGVLNRMARFRWKHRYFGVPIELKIANSVARKSRGYL